MPQNALQQLVVRQSALWHHSCLVLQLLELLKSQKYIAKYLKYVFQTVKFVCLLDAPPLGAIKQKGGQMEMTAGSPFMH